MKHLKTLIVFFSLSITCTWAQDAETAFHQAAGQYVKGSIGDARTTVASALQKYPNDPKLNSLMEKLKKENPENKEQPKEGEENEDKEPDNKEQDPNKEESEDDKEGEDKDKDNAEEDESAENKEEENEENAEENKDGEQGEKDEHRSRSEKLQEMNLTEEKALSILEAMKNSEIQYIQQNRRKIKENANYGKPDW